MMGKNGYEDDTDYTSSFTTDKDYVPNTQRVKLSSLAMELMLDQLYLKVRNKNELKV